jgi:prepilin-type N-terminal cleavage/methylation domain-containing protein
MRRYPDSQEKGFTLIETMIAILIFSIGILVVAKMQIHAIVGNSDAAWRGSANSISMSFFEELRGISFNDALLKDSDADEIAGLDDGRATSGTPTSPSSADHQFNGTIGLTYQLDNGNLVDATGRQYQVFWNVADNTMPSGEVASKVIRLFVYWQSQMGSRSVIMTTVRYNNVSL